MSSPKKKETKSQKIERLEKELFDLKFEDTLAYDESEMLQNSFISKYRYTPFNCFGILLSLLGLLISISDTIKPSKMSPMGVFIGIAIGLFGLFLMLISYLSYRLIPKQKLVIYFIQLIIVILIILQTLKLMGVSNLIQWE